MDESAPITWLIERIVSVIHSGAASTATNISEVITPLVSTCFGIYVILMMVNYLRGLESEPVFDFFLKIAAWSITIGIGLNATNYVSYVIPIVTGLGDDLASAAGNGTSTANSLDHLALHYIRIIQEGFESTVDYGITDLFLGLILSLKALLIIIGLVPFLVSATVCLLIAKVGSLLIAMVGPLFFAALLFPITRQYFSSWVNSAISYALIPLFVAVIATISVDISIEMLSIGGNLSETSFKSVFFATIGNLLLLVLLRWVTSLASALSSGGIVAAQYGGVGSMGKGMVSSVGKSFSQAASASRNLRELSKFAKGQITSNGGRIRPG